MAQINSAGIGSGLNVASLIEQILAAERAPAESRLARRESQIQSQISALGRFRASLDALRTASEAFSPSQNGSAKRALSSDEDLFKASATAAAHPGRYQIEVVTRATAHKLSSSPYASAATAVGAGTLTLGVGGDTFSVTTTASTTLDELRAAINAASDNTGVTASLITTHEGARLILSARETGLAQELTVTSADAPLQGLVYDPPGVSNLGVITPAADARIRVDGFTHDSASNTISGVIPGVTLNLVAAAPGTLAQLDVEDDTAAAKTAVQTFVEKYNALADVIAESTRYDAATRRSGPLLGDTLLRNLGGALRGHLGEPVTGGGYELLSQIGVSSGRDGKLRIDESRLDAALAQDPAAVAQLFSASDGVGARIAGLADEYLETNGRLTSRTNSLEARLEDIDDQRDRLELRLSRIESRYRTQFAALDTLMAQMNATSQYLTQQLSQLNPGG